MEVTESQYRVVVCAVAAVLHERIVFFSYYMYIPVPPIAAILSSSSWGFMAGGMGRV
jgi:hypothetical protein